MEKKCSRNVSLDIIRVIALFCVISVHFFKNNEFYSTIIMGKRMYIMTLMRTFFMICVPLFIVLTGYLMNKKRICKKYYLGIVKVIVIYIFVSIVCIIYKILSGGNFSFTVAIGEILNFTAVDYAWYVEMYIGLFLMIPFLNVLWNNLETKGQKRLLIITFLLLTAIPNIINIYEFGVVGWWKTPIISNDYSKLVPEWWKNIYPITYFFIGCYINEFRCCIKKSLLLVLLMGSIIIFGTFNYYRSYGGIFLWGDWQTWGALPNVVMTMLVFLLLLHIDFSWISEKGKRVLGKISGICFGAYLSSWIFDATFYPILNTTVEYMQDRMVYYFIIVPAVFLCSLLLSYILDCIYSGGVKLLHVGFHLFNLKI